MCPSPTLQWSMPHDSHCYKLSPLQGCWAGATVPAFSGWLVYLQFAWGSAPPPLQWSFPHDNHCYKLSPTRLLGGCLHSCLLWQACLFTGHMRECPSSTLQSSGHPALFATCLFFFSCLFIIQFGFFPFFPWAGVSLSRGLCWFVPGSTTWHLFANLRACQVS
jgi:hypothetical protein